MKSPLKGFCRTNVYMNPLTNSPDDEQILFLTKFLEWLDAWKSMKLNQGTTIKGDT